jgi:preprotein translocase subunit YajC
LVTAYSIFWLLMLGFVWMTWRRQQNLTNRLQNIESRIASLQQGGGSK